MRPESQKLLHDVQTASDLIVQFTDGVSFGNYANNNLLRSAVERQFKIVGEAINQLSHIDSELAARITSFRRIIDFRNFLIHGCSHIDNEVVWDIVTEELSVLTSDVRKLLQENGDA